MTNVGKSRVQVLLGEGVVEQTVASIFEALLTERKPQGGPVDTSRSDDFFELGGNSMLAARLVVKLRREFEVDVSVRDIFQGRTVAALSQAIRRRLEAAE